VEGFKLKDSGRGGRSHNARAIPSGWGLRVANESRDKYSSAVSQAEKQKTNNLKGEHGHGRSSCTPPRKPARSSSSLESLCTNARSVGNKQEESEICARSQGHDLIAMTETWWDSSHDWNAVMDGYTLFGKDMPPRRGGGVALHVKEQLECIELCLGAAEEGVKSLWVRTKGQAHMSDVIVGLYYRPPDQEEEVDEAFHRQLKVASQSQGLVLVGDFNHLDISWEDHTARHMQPRRFLHGISDNFLMQVVEEPAKRGALLDLVLTNKERLAEDVKVGGSLGCSGHEMVNFRILCGGSRQ